MSSSALEHVMDQIGLRKMTKAYDAEQKKLIFVVTGVITVADKTTTVGSAASRLLTSCGLVRKQGVAPSGYLERRLGDALNKAKKSSKR